MDAAEPFVALVIYPTTADAQARQADNLVKIAEKIRLLPGFLRARILLSEDGRNLVTLTEWSDRSSFEAFRESEFGRAATLLAASLHPQALWLGIRDRGRALSFSRQILVGVAAGIALGLFLGEAASFLGFAADGFVQLLQMTVLPYVTVSLVRGLGSLRPDEAKHLGWRTGRILLVFWGVALGLAFLFPSRFPWSKALPSSARRSFSPASTSTS